MRSLAVFWLTLLFSLLANGVRSFAVLWLAVLPHEEEAEVVSLTAHAPSHAEVSAGQGQEDDGAREDERHGDEGAVPRQQEINVRLELLQILTVITCKNNNSKHLVQTQVPVRPGVRVSSGGGSTFETSILVY